MTYWTYMLLSERGKIYVGHTQNLKARLRSHNDPERARRWTSGDVWHLLAAQPFATRLDASRHEIKIKRDSKAKREWLKDSRSRIHKLMARYKIHHLGKAGANYQHIFSP